MLKKDFDIIAFNAQFDQKIEQLKGAEKITKAVMRDLSRELLDQIHFNGDIQPINRLLDVLTPVNRKIAVLYFKHFSGFHYSDDEKKFGKKDKQNYQKKYQMASDFLDDEDADIWTWSMEHVDIQAKPIDLAKITQMTSNMLKKAEKAGLSQEQVFRAMLAGGLEVDTLLAILTAANDEAMPKAA